MGEGTAVVWPGRANVVRALLIVCGGVLLTAALLYNRYTLAPLASGAFEPLTLEKIRRVQWGFGAAGVLAWAAAWALARRPTRVGSRGAEGLLLLLVGLLPFALLDFGLRPFVEPRATVFQEDAELGWRIALGDLDGLLDAAEASGARTLVVIFPYALQLEAPLRLGAPQRKLVRYLRERGTPALDLLPRFAAHPEPRTLLLDSSHLSALGHALAAEAIVQAVRAGSLLPAAPGASGA